MSQEYDLDCENRSEEQRSLHNNRIAFIIDDEKIYYIEKNDKSHFELAVELGISKEKFDNLCRGFYFKDYIVFYKGHFIYDDEIIDIAKKTIGDIKKHIGLNKKIKVYCGQRVGGPNEIWPPDKYIGEF